MTAAALAVGSLGGLGAFLALRMLLVRTPAARPALRRLHPAGVGPPVATTGRRWARRLLGWLWRPPARELAILGRSSGQYALSLSVSALVGAAAVATTGVLLAAAGIGLPAALPVAVALAAAAVAAWGAHHDLLARAARARYEFRRAVCTYLDLVALELAAGHGPVAALERACTGIDGWVFTRIRQSLLRAQLQLHQPWEELRALAGTIDVPELGDVGDIVQTAGAEGAVVHHSLLARARALRDQIRVEALARAKAVTTKLDIPGALLLLIVAIFATYPLLSRVSP